MNPASPSSLWIEILLISVRSAAYASRPPRLDSVSCTAPIPSSTCYSPTLVLKLSPFSADDYNSAVSTKAHEKGVWLAFANGVFRSFKVRAHGPFLIYFRWECYFIGEVCWNWRSEGYWMASSFRDLSCRELELESGWIFINQKPTQWLLAFLFSWTYWPPWNDLHPVQTPPLPKMLLFLTLLISLARQVVFCLLMALWHWLWCRSAQKKEESLVLSWFFMWGCLPAIYYLICYLPLWVIVHLQVMALEFY